MHTKPLRTSLVRTRRLIQRLTVIPLLLATAAFGQLTVYSAGSVAIGGSRQLTAYVPLVVNIVTWSVNDVVGGNSTVGTVSPTGLYRAPAAAPMANVVMVRATSTADASKFDQVPITITQPVPNLWSISPNTVPAGSFTITLNGGLYSASSVVNFGGTPLTTTYLSPTGLRATGLATAAQVGTTLPITVTNPGNGAATSTAVGLKITVANPVLVSIAPLNQTVSTSATRQFAATVMNTSNTSVTWSVNGVNGGSATAGTISVAGLYMAPAAVTNPATVTVRATSVADPTVSASTSVTVQVPPPPAVTVSVAPSSLTLAPSVAQPFIATVANAANTAVTWSVNGITGGSATVGTISAAGLYQAPAAAPNPPGVTVRVTSVASPTVSATAAVNIVGPPNPGTGQGTPNLSAGRFLEQTTFGPTATDIAKVKQIGFDAWLTEQFNMPETQIANPGTQASNSLQELYLNRLATAPDQLRQRVASALSQIIVISMNKNIYSDEMVPYLQILSRNAFGSYRTLLSDITVSSQMGKYLDLARSMKPTALSGANENYARELTQLFTLGLYQLNPDGTPVVDGQGKPVALYNQTDIQQIALALTGWVYINNAYEDFSGPMVPWDTNHDKNQKSFLGCTLPAGQNTVTDTNATLDCLFQHQNIGPFLAQRLIRSLVMSNPSGAYVQRIAAVFANNGAGVRGDLKAVVRAILLDPEARNDTAGPLSGRLKDPIFHVVSFVRALGGTIAPSNGLPWMFSQLAQTPPSVFSFYSPLFRIPKTTTFGPEFQIYTPTESVMRGNFLYSVLLQPSQYGVDLGPFLAVAANTPALIDLCDQTLLYGRMPQAMRQSLATAMAAQQDNNSRVQTALYLTALSGLQAIQY